MQQLITGLHHVTALASDAQKNIDFYAGILGLRLVKKTINFDAPDVYHFYFGDETGTPGTIMTFFPYQDLVRGRHGTGQLTVTMFSIPAGALDYWMQRLSRFGITYRGPQERFDETYLSFADNDGLALELVARDGDMRAPWDDGPVPVEHAIRGFYGVTLSEEGYERTAGLLTAQMDYTLIAEKGNRFRFAAGDHTPGYVDIVCNPDGMRGRGGAGTVHHVAFATADGATQMEFRDKVRTAGVNATPVLDRQYFRSIYFREPGGVLFEVATSDAGFTIDEPKDQLGTALKLPSWEEHNRAAIAQQLVPVTFDANKFTG